MSDGIYSALSGAVAQQRSLDVVANNVANANTVGFRADRVAFDQALIEQRGGGNVPLNTRNRDAQSPNNPLRFVTADRMQTDYSTGVMQQTGNPLDTAIQGDGFFSVRTPNGERFTRAGDFVRDAAGTIRTQNGFEVLGVNGEPIRIPQNAREVEMSRDGIVSADGVAVGRFKLSSFEDPTALRKEGNTLFVGNAEAAQPSSAEIVQGYVESANVNAVSGLNELITVSRLFDTFQKVIQGFKDLDNRAARDLGSRNG